MKKKGLKISVVTIMLLAALTGCSEKDGKTETTVPVTEEVEVTTGTMIRGIVLSESKKRNDTSISNQAVPAADTKEIAVTVVEQEIKVADEPAPEAEPAEIKILEAPVTETEDVPEEVTEELEEKETPASDMDVANMEGVLLFEDMESMEDTQTAGDGYARFLESMGAWITERQKDIVEGICLYGQTDAGIEEQKEAFKAYENTVFLDNPGYCPGIDGESRDGEGNLVDVYYRDLDAYGSQEKLVNLIVDTYGLSTGASDAETVMMTRDRVHQKMAYDMRANDDEMHMADCINSGIGVCWTYAKVYTVLLNLEGIQARYVSGDCDGSGHAWVEANVDGQWMILECTSENGCNLFGGDPSWDYEER